MLSFWEKESLTTYDIIIVGGGITGLSAAISLKEKSPKLSIAVFEAGLLPSGASTKNAGFTCFGSLTEIISDEKKLGTEKMLELIEQRWEGLEMLRTRLGDDAIDFQQLGGYELLFDYENMQQKIEEMNEKLYPIFKSNVYHKQNKDINRFSFNSQLVKQLIYNPFEGQIHTGMMMKALSIKASESGVVIFTNARVDKLTSDGVLVNEIEFKSNQTIIATNAFTKLLMPETNLTPGRGQVCITKPIANLGIKGTFHYNEGYYYFRNVGNRVLFGGGRNKAFDQEETTILEVNTTIQNHLIDQLTKFILPNTPFEIEHQWSGIMGFSEDKYPIIKRINNRTVVAVKLGGIGVALGSSVGNKAANITLD
jgi:glycine/D-amino acid oxidase-like deaminating enzyme